MTMSLPLVSRLALFAFATPLFVAGCSEQAASQPISNGQQHTIGTNRDVRLKILVGNRQFGAMLEEIAATRAFIALLTLELKLKYYHQTEKIADLSERLPTEGRPDGITPASGDIAYYAPWGNLAIFNREFDYSRGLIRLGKLDGRIEEVAKLANGSIQIERVQ